MGAKSQKRGCFGGADADLVLPGQTPTTSLALSRSPRSSIWPRRGMTRALDEGWPNAGDLSVRSYGFPFGGWGGSSCFETQVAVRTGRSSCGNPLRLLFKGTPCIWGAHILRSAHR